MRKYFNGVVVSLVVIALVVGLAPASAGAASHREAPLISLDPTADITDFFMFRSYEAGQEDKIVLVMDVIPGEEPSSGPNYYNFDPSVRYSFHIDNNMDGKADDVRFDIRFKNEFRGVNRDLGLFLSYVALPPITTLDGSGSEGLGLRQTYTVSMLTKVKQTVLGSDLIAVPSNVGPATMPDYAALATQGIRTLDQGVRVFAGQRDDPFYIDLGGVFDTLNLRRTPPLLTAAEDADDTNNPFGTDMLSGFNVHTIALEVPASLLTRDKKGPGDTEQPILGGYASTSRSSVRVMREDGEKDDDGDKRTWIQVQRLANPLINEAIIGTVDKDKWNALNPSKENRFDEYYLNPRLALALETVYGVPAATTNRTDLVDLLLKYNPADNKLSELLRLNISVAPTAFADQSRLTVLAGDNAGWPNGRRPIDDVTDIAIRVVGGPNYAAGLAGDGVNVNDLTLSETFPFLATPWDGRNRIHQNGAP